ncbi:MAG: hypothetical protein FWC10_06915, partial [Lentimicrobiaceae bacterium]|nr:hypothetical protein [Lentimicrobiaceae bacterium]
MAKKTHSSTTNTTEFERLLNSISNNTPMLFFPVRIETHFRNQTYEAPKETDLLKILKSFKNLSEEVINLKLSRKKLSLTPALAKTLGTVRSADLISKENIKELTLLCNDVFDEINAMGANTKYTKYKEDILVALNDVAIAKEEVVSEEEKEEEAEEVDTSSFLEKKIAEKAPKLLFPGQKIIFNTKAKGISQLQAWTEDTIFTLTRNLKTNFKPYTQKELCVRIFPTEIFLDYLTDALTEAEIADGKMFWLQWYVASGSKKSEYEAWRVLCAKYPVYRAAWIVRSMKPKNINKYKKGNTWFYRRPYQGMEEIQEGCLTIYNNLAKITLSEQQDVNPNTTEYNNETKIREHIGIIKENLFHIESKIMICEYIVDYLYDNISSTVNYLKRRLNSFLRFYERFPGIYGDNPRQMELWDVDYTMLKTFRNEVNLLLEKLTSKRISLQDIMNKYLDDPKHMKEFFPTVQVNKSGKPDMPVSNILPDRFLFIGEEDNRKAKVVQQIGKRVKRNLQMGINLNEDAEAEPYKISNTGELEVNGGLAWMVDYDKAEEAGMAITVPVDMSVSGFKYIYVLGVCTPTEKE